MPPYNIQDRTFEFACRIIDFCRPLFERGVLLRELARQLLRSGTSIGANLQEAGGGETKDDFRHKVAVARKESLETRFWIRLLHYADGRLSTEGTPLLAECSEIVAILTTIKKNSETSDSRGGTSHH
jgi:four helix bundle protein